MYFMLTLIFFIDFLIIMIMHFRMYDRGMRYIFSLNISLKIMTLDFYFVEPPHL